MASCMHGHVFLPVHRMQFTDPGACIVPSAAELGTVTCAPSHLHLLPFHSHGLDLHRTIFLCISNHGSPFLLWTCLCTCSLRSTSNPIQSSRTFRHVRTSSATAHRPLVRSATRKEGSVRTKWKKRRHGTASVKDGSCAQARASDTTSKYRHVVWIGGCPTIASKSIGARCVQCTSFDVQIDWASWPASLD